MSKLINLVFDLKNSRRLASHGHYLNPKLFHVTLIVNGKPFPGAINRGAGTEDPFNISTGSIMAPNEAIVFYENFYRIARYQVKTMSLTELQIGSI